MKGLSQTIALYVAGLKVAARALVIFVVVLLALAAVVSVSLPAKLFTTNDIPKISLAIVYGDGTHDDAFIHNLNRGLAGVSVVEEVHPATAAEAEELLAAGEVDAILELPANTLDVLMYGGHSTVTVKASDPVLGAAVYAVTDEVVETLDELQNYALVYSEAARGYMSSSTERAVAENNFSMALIGQAFSRMNSVETPAMTPPLLTQALTLLLFLTVSIGAFFVAVVAARQHASGYVRHLFLKGVRFRHLLLSRLLLSASIASVLGVVLAFVFGFIGAGVSPGALILSSVVLSLVLTALYLMFSGFRGQAPVAVTRTLLGCLALMFLLLFAGGGFYPTGLMHSGIRLFNPTWLSHQLAAWSLGGSVDVVQLALFIVPFAFACGVCYLEWRRAL